MELNLKSHGTNRRRSLVPTTDLLQNHHQRHADHFKGRTSRRFSDSEFIENVRQVNEGSLSDRSQNSTVPLSKTAKEFEEDHKINEERKNVRFEQSPTNEQKSLTSKFKLLNLALKATTHFSHPNTESVEKSPKSLKGEQLKSPLNSDSKENADILSRIEEANNETEDETKDGSPEYVISTFPPIGKDDIDKHRLLNIEAEENSKKQPHVYEEYLRKLYVQKKLLEKRKREEEQRMLRRRARRLQLLKMRSREAKEDETNESEVRPESSKKDFVRRKKIIQSFRYSRAIEEYYKGQLGSDIVLLDDDYLFNLGGDEVVNGWLVKSVGPQVLNFHARSMPSCNPILLRLRQREANRRALQRSRLNKKYSNLSSNSSQKLSKSYDSLSSVTREPLGLNISLAGNLTARIDYQMLSNIPELHTKNNLGKLTTRKSKKSTRNV